MYFVLRQEIALPKELVKGAMVLWGNEFPFRSPGDRRSPGTEPISPALAGGSFTSEPLGKLVTQA